MDYEKLFAWEYRNPISNQCTAETGIEVIHFDDRSHRRINNLK